MIDYLTHPKFLNYDPSVLPSSQGGGGGMGTKTYRVLEALKKGTPNDPAAKAERLTEPPGTTKEAFNEYVTNEIRDYFLEANRIWNEEYERMERTQTDPVPDYLPAGKRIDWTYPD